MAEQHHKVINSEDIILLKINVFKKAIVAPEESLNQSLEARGYSFSFSQKNAFNHAQEAARIRLYILLEVDNEDQSKSGIYGEFGIEFHYQIKGLDNYTHQIENDTHYYYPELGITLLGIAYSTSRGIILQETRGTVLSATGVILPVLNPNVLLQEGEE